MAFYADHPHYLYSIPNSHWWQRNFLEETVPMYMDTLPSECHEHLSAVELLNELKSHIASFTTSVAISEFLGAPQFATNLKVFDSKCMKTFTLPRKDVEAAHGWSRVDREFIPTMAYHGTALDRSLRTAAAGKMMPGIAHSGNKNNVVYFHLNPDNVGTYAVLAPLSNGRCPQYLWSVAIELTVDMNRISKCNSHFCAPKESIHTAAFNVQVSVSHQTSKRSRRNMQCNHSEH